MLFRASRMKARKVQITETLLQKKKNSKMLANFGKISNGSCLKTQTHLVRKSQLKLPSHLYKRIY